MEAHLWQLYERWDGLARLLCSRRVFAALGTAKADQSRYAANTFAFPQLGKSVSTPC